MKLPFQKRSTTTAPAEVARLAADLRLAEIVSGSRISVPPRRSPHRTAPLRNVADASLVLALSFRALTSCGWHANMVG